MDRTFRLILAPFLGLAAIGFILSLAAHLAALAGSPIPFGKAVWGLHAGIFVVWLPTVLVGILLTRAANQRTTGRSPWPAARNGCEPLYASCLVTPF